MGFPFSVTGTVSLRKAPNDMRSIEDVCAQIDEMLKAIKAKTRARQGATVSYTPGLFPVVPSWNMPAGVDRGEITVEDAGTEWRLSYFGSVVRVLVFTTLVIFVFAAVLLHQNPKGIMFPNERLIAFLVFVWLLFNGINYLGIAIRFKQWLKRGVSQTA
jgi:hypothetical protein